jgi:hypothetical protein
MATIEATPPDPRWGEEEVIVLETLGPHEGAPAGDADWVVLDDVSGAHWGDPELAGSANTRRAALQADAPPGVDPQLDALVAAHLASLPRASELPRVESDATADSLDVLLEANDAAHWDRADTLMIDVGSAAPTPDASSADAQLESSFLNLSKRSGDPVSFDGMVRAHLGALFERSADVFDIDPEPTSEAMDALDGLPCWTARHPTPWRRSGRRPTAMKPHRRHALR